MFFMEFTGLPRNDTLFKDQEFPTKGYPFLDSKKISIDLEIMVKPAIIFLLKILKLALISS